MKMILRSEHSSHGEITEEVELSSYNVHNIEEALEAFANFLRASGFFIDTLEHVRFDKDMDERYTEYLKGKVNGKV